MAHIFEFSKMKMLDTVERRKILPPEPILRKLGVRAGMVLVDVGCGTGYFSFPAAAIVDSHGFVWGIDIQQEFVDYCTEKAKAEHIENIIFLKSASSSLPIKDATADAVLISTVLHEIENGEKEKYIKDMARILKSDGKLWIIEWKKEEGIVGPPLGERLGIDDIRAIAEHAALRIEDIFDVSSLHYAVILKK